MASPGRVPVLVMQQVEWPMPQREGGGGKEDGSSITCEEHSDAYRGEYDNDAVKHQCVQGKETETAGCQCRLEGGRVLEFGERRS